MTTEPSSPVADAFALLGSMRPGESAPSSPNFEARCAALHWIAHLVTSGDLDLVLAANVVQRYVLINWSYLDRVVPTREPDDVPADLALSLTMLTSEPLGGTIELTLDRVDLRGILLWGAQLAGARLGRCRLALADLGQATLDRASFMGSNLEGAMLFKAHGQAVNFWGAVMPRAVLKRAAFPDAVFDRAILRSAVLAGADLRGARFAGADLRDANFTGCDLTGADLRGARVDGADFSQARLDDVHRDDDAPALTAGAQ